MTLPYGSNTLEVYVKGTQSPPTALQQRTPRSEFEFVKPIGIDAWGSRYSQYIVDITLNRVFEISGEYVSVVAGTGEKGCKDGDGLTEATFEAIHSITVLSNYIAVLSSTESIRLINRATNQVSTLSYFPSNKGAFYLLNASQSLSSHTVCLTACDEAYRLRTYHLPTADSQPRYRFTTPSVCIFKSADKTIEAPFYDATCITSSLDGSPLATRSIKSSFLRSVFPVYCPRSDSLFAVSSEEVCFYRNFFGRKETLPAIELDDASNLLDPSGLIHDLEITHNASKSTFKLFRSVIDRHMQPPLSSSPSSLLQNLIPTSTLPISTIRRFLEYIYFKPLDETDSSKLIALAWMYKKVYGKEDPIILKALQDQIYRETDSAVHNLLISAWMDTSGPFELDEASLVVAMMLPKVQQNRLAFKLAFDAEVTKHASNLHLILSRMTFLLIMVFGPSLDSALPEIENVPRDRFEPIINLNDTPDFLALYSTNFAIVHPSYGTIGVCGWLLYIHWPWFKRLIDSGLQESKSRIITLPQDSFTPVGLLSILLVLQIGSPKVDPLSLEDAVSILKHASQYDLIGLDDTVLPQVAPLIEACETMVFPPLTTENCWNQLRLAHSVGSSKYPSIFEFILKTTDKVAFDELGTLPEAVAQDLLRKG